MKDYVLTTASLLIVAVSLLPVSSTGFAHEENPFLLQDDGAVRVTRNMQAEKNYQGSTAAPEGEEQAKTKAKQWVPVRYPVSKSSSDSTPVPCVALCGDTLASEEEEQAKEKAKQRVPARNHVTTPFSDSAIVPCVALCE